MRFHNPFSPPPAPPAFGSGKVVPESSASFLSKVVFQWISPFLDVGYSRPLQKDDFWELPPKNQTATITRNLEENFYRRCPPEKRPQYMRQPVEKPVEKSESSSTIKDPVVIDNRGFLSRLVSRKRPHEQREAYDESFFKAIYYTFTKSIIISGILKLLADTLNTTTPLVTKILLTWLTESYTYSRLSTKVPSASAQIPPPRGIGYGIGLAVALFVMQESASLMTNHFQQIAMTVGLSVRAGVIGTVFRKSLRTSGRARTEHSVGEITTIISADSSRLDRFSAFGHIAWISPIQVSIGVGLLISNLGYSALVGLGVLILGFPIQFIFVRIMFTQRKKGIKITDKRVRLTTEVLQGIRLIKLYAWETFYATQIGDLRHREIKTIRKVALARSSLIASVNFIPVLASILSFITYALSGHDLNVAVIFSSLQLFNIIRYPLIFFPFVLASLSDALVAVGRISRFLTSEDLQEPYPVEPESPNAVHVDGDFAWETVISLQEVGGKFGKGSKDGKGGKQGKSAKEKEKEKKEGKAKPAKRRWRKSAAEKDTKSEVLPTSFLDNEKAEETLDEGTKEDQPFELKNLNLTVPKGAFVGIVGRVGSGKSSILQALIGEMRKVRGEVTFGGKVSYSPQTPWIRNATLRENILFGQADDEERFREVIRACSLEHDLEVLPHGENTEIGEKGINLSGGQKARVSLARAAYSNSEVVLLDDPLSAVDAYVGKSILENCLLSGPLASRTRVLVTHSLHVLDKMDYIYVLDNGTIIEQGTFTDLMGDSVVFSRLMEEYGSQDAEEVDPLDGNTDKKSRKKKTASDDSVEDAGKKTADDPLMQLEERNTGAVTWGVYRQYLGFAGGLVWVPFVLLLLIMAQGSQVGSNLFLGFWTSESIPGFHQGHYMAVYTALGVSQALFTFILSFSFALITLAGSLNLFRTALNRVLRSPTSFFDTTPMGRILSRLSKDQDTLDNELSMSLMMFLNSFAAILGTAALVFYTFPYLGIIFVPMIALYYVVASFYRRSSVETKRLDSLMRSILYGSFSETLTGLATIRAYREQARSIHEAEVGLDLENRAYYMTISIQRWLGVRLDFFGNILIFGIALFASGFRHSVSPSKIGVVLTYTLSVTQTFSELVTQFATNEQNMNAVERVLHYAELPSEGDSHTPDDPPSTWPDKGKVDFSDVEMAYRPGLPLVLKGVSFSILAGEKIGVVGRTGAGKSSLIQALFRMVELQGGTIEIDGRDIRTMGLDSLRSGIAIVPQDSTLFLGTLRENLDPQGLRTDAELISVLQRAGLLPKDGPVDPATEAKFSLDSTVGDEGANFSAGEKQLLALCRALVKNSKVIVLDEATSSVDVETDSKVQRTIQTEFASSTLLCIAHRLNTIAFYDRIIVMDQGQIAEFDTVLNLFDKVDSIFRSLCDEANLQRVDIVRIRSDHGLSSA